MSEVEIKWEEEVASARLEDEGQTGDDGNGERARGGDGEAMQFKTKGSAVYHPCNVCLYMP
ncbi:hypothetical protein ACLOJK_039201 [Asimina triloba]